MRICQRAPPNMRNANCEAMECISQSCFGAPLETTSSDIRVDPFGSNNSAVWREFKGKAPILGRSVSVSQGSLPLRLQCTTVVGSNKIQQPFQVPKEKLRDLINWLYENPGVHSCFLLCYIYKPICLYTSLNLSIYIYIHTRVTYMYKTTMLSKQTLGAIGACSGRGSSFGSSGFGLDLALAFASRGVGVVG